jgi:AraC-like DNA-binding protein
MLILRSLPNLADTPDNREFRQSFYSRLGEETLILSARTLRGAYPSHTHPLSIKASWGGTIQVHFDDRSVAVDDDNYLVVNTHRTYATTGSSLESYVPMNCFSVYFRPGMAEETLSAMIVAVDRVLDLGSDLIRGPVDFPEVLCPHDILVSPMLRYIDLHVKQGIDDELWYEEQLSFLLERMFRVRRHILSAADRFSSMRPATRREILRRIGLSVDYINTYYTRQLDIGDLAQSASLSTFHFIRLFRACQGITPHAYLQRKRAAVASRLLRSKNLSRDQVAARVGFENRTTMLRNLRRLAGPGPSAPCPAPS